MASNGKVTFDKNYFDPPSPGWMAGLGTSIPFVLVTAFDPNLFPTSAGPLRTAALYLARNHPTLMLVWAASIVIAHYSMSVYAATLCTNAGMTTNATIRWTLSTLCFGYPSLQLKLIPYLKNARKPKV